jgi:hypothetical protein
VSAAATKKPPFTAASSFQKEPSDGLEPSTPSLPWRLRALGPGSAIALYKRVSAANRPFEPAEARAADPPSADPQDPRPIPKTCPQASACWPIADASAVPWRAVCESECRGGVAHRSSHAPRHACGHRGAEVAYRLRISPHVRSESSPRAWLRPRCRIDRGGVAMHALKHHLAHHRGHVLGCGVGVLLLALGAALESPVLAIGGAVVCGAFCFSMVRIVVVRPRRS